VSFQQIKTTNKVTIKEEDIALKAKKKSRDIFIH